jgi:hypothetical protein
MLLAHKVFQALRPHALSEGALAIVDLAERGCIEQAHNLIIMRGIIIRRRLAHQRPLPAGFIQHDAGGDGGIERFDSNRRNGDI